MTMKSADPEIRAFRERLEVRKEVSIWEKDVLTISEMAAYTGIGITKLYTLCKELGGKVTVCLNREFLIKRKPFEKFIEKSKSI